MPAAVYLTPDLLIVTYHGAKFSFTVDANQLLEDYSFDFSVRSGTKDVPGAKVLEIKSAGNIPNYITVSETGDPGEEVTRLTVEVPASVSADLDPGQYYAELIGTPAGGDPVFMGWAVWNHEPTGINA
jgi:hypothetical protein